MIWCCRGLKYGFEFKFLNLGLNLGLNLIFWVLNLLGLGFKFVGFVKNVGMNSNSGFQL